MKQLALAYPAKITQDTDGFYVTFLDFEIFSDGDTIEEAVFNAQEALDVTLLGIAETDQEIPTPSKTRSKDIYVVPASPEVAVPVMLYMSRKNDNKTISDIATTMDVSFQRYHDIEQGRNITLKTLKKAAAAMGATVEIKFNFAS